MTPIKILILEVLKMWFRLIYVFVGGSMVTLEKARILNYSVDKNTDPLKE